MTEKKKRVVVIAVGRNHNNSKLLDFYCTHIQNEGDILIILSIHQPPSIKDTLLFGSDPKTTNSYIESLKESIDESNKLLIDIKSEWEGKTGDATYILRSVDDSVGATICGYTKDIDADIVIIGTRSLGLVSRFFLGSVSDYVVHNLEKVHVCIVPENK